MTQDFSGAMAPIGMIMETCVFTPFFHHESYLFYCCRLYCVCMPQMILPSSNIDYWFWISLSMSFDICCELKVEFGCQNQATSTNERVMTPFDLSKSTLNYVYFKLLHQLFPYKIAGTCDWHRSAWAKTYQKGSNDPN